MLLDGNSAYPLSFCPYSETGICISYSFNAFGGIYYTCYHGYRSIGLHGSQNSNNGCLASLVSSAFSRFLSFPYWPRDRRLPARSKLRLPLVFQNMTRLVSGCRACDCAKEGFPVKGVHRQLPTRSTASLAGWEIADPK